MNDYWWTNGFFTWSMLLLLGILQLNFIFSSSLNHEGIALLKFRERVVNDPYKALSSWKEENGEANPCSWFGIGCVGGRVVSLNLINLCLEGTLAPELHHLLHIKSIILRNNSFSGFIPKEYRNLKELELLDLGYNRFCEPIPREIEQNIPTLLLNNNGLSCHMSPDVEDTTLLEIHEDKSQLNNYVEVLPHPRQNDHAEEVVHSRILQEQLRGEARGSEPDEARAGVEANHHHSAESPIAKAPSILTRKSPPPPSSDPAFRIPTPNLTKESSSLQPPPQPPPTPSTVNSRMPNLKRSELITACEDFSNVIGSSSIGTIYKGTFSNGVEIAVISLVAASAKDWSRNLETQFRKKIETLSKVNHKNFVNIIGYCEEEEPFTRMMVFEYAPNGSLFEHLHVKEAEHLDWAMRLRVAMGMAYCLEHMHQLTPPVTHPNLNSSAVNLSEDYAAKISDFCFWNEVAVPRVQPLAIGLSSVSTTSVEPGSNVYSFGLLLLEMMTGRIPHSAENNSLDGWVLEYMRGEKLLKEMVDPMLRHFKPEQLDKISEVTRKCLHSEQNRPTMIEVTARLKEITGIIPDKAVPRFSSLWWTELDARSVNGT
uniref:Protein kinase domain-containing protein n=1 Tax=Chenopodium quinoa TaxID=63459 RepID=A0A803M3X9_CHEQI